MRIFNNINGKYNKNTNIMNQTRSIFSVILLLLCSATLQAQVAYLLRTSSIGDLPAENYNSVDEQPERNAATWFKDSYSTTEEKVMLSIAQVKGGALLSGGAPAYKVLWVNVDAVGIADLAAAGIDSELITAIGNYVRAGGNLYLTKQATRIVCDINRMGYLPGWGNGGYGVGGDVWSINAHLGIWPDIPQDFDRRTYPLLRGMAVDNTIRAYRYLEVDYTFPTFPLIGAVPRTDNNCLWADLYRKDPGTGGQLAPGATTHYENGNPLRLTDFETDWNCTVVAVWGHVVDFCSAGLIDFKPDATYKGHIVANGFAAYQWGTSNDYIGNVQALTAGVLDYLTALRNLEGCANCFLVY